MEQAIHFHGREGEITIREGKAPEVIIPEGSIHGIIPSSIDEVIRKIKFDPNCTLVEVDRANLTIKITTNMKSTTQKKADIYYAQFKPASELTQFKINQEHYWDPKELSRLIKMNRHMIDDGLTIAGNLNNLLAKVNKNIEKRQDDRANTIDRYEQEVQTNLPETLTLTSPLFKGYDVPVKFDADINFKLDGRQVQIFLTSYSLKEATETFATGTISAIVENIRAQQPELVVVEV